MALNPVILKKINEEITAAQDNAAALKIAIIRLALLHSLENQQNAPKTVKEFDDVFNNLNDTQKTELYMSPVAQERSQQEKDKNFDKFDNKLKAIMATFHADMDKIIQEEVLVNVDSNDPAERQQQEQLRAQQQALLNGEGATVPTQEQADVALEIENSIAAKTTLLKPSPEGAKVKDGADEEEKLAVKAFIDTVRRMTQASVLNPGYMTPPDHRKRRDVLAEKTAATINDFERSFKEILLERNSSSTERGLTSMLQLAFLLGRGTQLSQPSLQRAPEGPTPPQPGKLPIEPQFRGPRGGVGG